MSREHNKKQNKYSEEFKITIVSAIRAGVTAGSLMRRFGMPFSSIENWKRHKKFKDIGPASAEILENLPPDPHIDRQFKCNKMETATLVRIPQDITPSVCCKNIIIRQANLSIEVPSGTKESDLRTFLTILKEM